MSVTNEQRERGNVRRKAMVHTKAMTTQTIESGQISERRQRTKEVSATRTKIFGASTKTS